jgi:hypothetical protein
MRRTVLLLASMVALGTLALPAMAQSDQFRADQIRLDVESGRLDPWTACHDEAYYKVYGTQYCDGAVGDEDPSNDDFTVADALKTIDCPPSPACIGTDRAETFQGTWEHDWVGAQGGNDRVYAGGGSDKVRGGDGRDTLFGEGSRDQLWGQGGDDRIDGGLRRDRISGDEGRDTIRAGEGNDSIFVRDGQKDRVDCGTDADEVTVDRLDVVSASCETVLD